jgi:thioredoxin 1
MSKKPNFNQLIGQASEPVLVDFYADWCGPCKAMAPELQKVASDLGDRLKVIKINVDRHQALAQQYRVQSIPALLLFKGGQVVWRTAGAMSASQLKAQLSKFV